MSEFAAGWSRRALLGAASAAPLALVACSREAEVAAAAAPAPVEGPPGPPGAPRVRLGIDRLLGEFSELLRGKRVGLVTHPAAVDGALTPTVDLLARDPRFQLVQLYGPEHGIRGADHAGESVQDARDELTGLPVESLYGGRRAPSEDTLRGIDVLVFELQDIGSRTYTFISTLGECMRACAAAGKPLVVLDRPNPLGGDRFEGPLREEEWQSFISWAAIPITHGMTIGELALYYAQTLGIACELRVVPMEGWRRWMRWSDTGLTWMQTSPHIPSEVQAQLYVATGMVGAVLKNVSEGVGSTMPFECVAAPFLEASSFARALRELELPGLECVPTVYKPFYGGYRETLLHGARLRLRHAHAFEPVRTALEILCLLEARHSGVLEFVDERSFGIHWGSVGVRDAIRGGASAATIAASWSEELEVFAAARARCLLYGPGAAST